MVAEDLGLPSIAFRRLPKLRPDGDAWIVAWRRPLLPQQAPGGACERGGALGGLPLGGDAGERKEVELAEPLTPSKVIFLPCEYVLAQLRLLGTHPT
jgi:hypothetical protein